MKNLTKNAGLLFIALGALFVTSCTKQDEMPVNGKAVETTKVNFAVTSAQQNVTGKMINRDAIPLYVDNVTITAASSALNPWSVSDTFTFSAAPDATLPHGFSLANVALGGNTFTATSTSAAANKVIGFQNLTLTPTQDGLQVMRGITPYIVCASAPVQATITKTGNAPVNLAMDTNNGRILAKFVKETPDADNYVVRVTATQGASAPTETIVSNTVGPKFYAWSNENAVVGNFVTFTINIYEKLPNGSNGPLLNTLTKVVYIQKATNTLCTFTVHNTDVHTDIADGGIVLSFPTLTDVIIND